jgi:hypothetical protein
MGKEIREPGKNFAANDKRKVWNGEKQRTRSGLTKADLMVRKYGGQIISKLKHRQGVELMRRLKREGRWNPAPPFR